MSADGHEVSRHLGKHSFVRKALVREEQLFSFTHGVIGQPNFDGLTWRLGPILDVIPRSGIGLRMLSEWVGGCSGICIGQLQDHQLRQISGFGVRAV